MPRRFPALITPLAALLCLALAASAYIPASAQSWPARQPIRLITPFPAGSAIDSIARPVFEQVGKQIGQGFVFESRPGAGGTIGMSAAPQAGPPRYTLLGNSAGPNPPPPPHAK